MHHITYHSQRYTHHASIVHDGTKRVEKKTANLAAYQKGLVCEQVRRNDDLGRGTDGEERHVTQHVYCRKMSQVRICRSRLVFGKTCFRKAHQSESSKKLVLLGIVGIDPVKSYTASLLCYIMISSGPFLFPFPMLSTCFWQALSSPHWKVPPSTLSLFTKPSLSSNWGVQMGWLLWSSHQSTTLMLHGCRKPVAWSAVGAIAIASSSGSPKTLTRTLVLYRIEYFPKPSSPGMHDIGYATEDAKLRRSFISIYKLDILPFQLDSAVTIRKSVWLKSCCFKLKHSEFESAPWLLSASMWSCWVARFAP